MDSYFSFVGYKLLTTGASLFPYQSKDDEIGNKTEKKKKLDDKHICLRCRARTREKAPRMLKEGLGGGAL